MFRHRTLGRLLLSSAILATGACDSDSPVGPDGDLGGAQSVSIQQSNVRLLSGDGVQLSAIDGTGMDVTGSVTWSVADASTLSVRGGFVEAVAPGVTFVRAELSGAVDSIRVVVTFGTDIADGVTLRLQETGAVPMQLTGAAFLHDRFNSDADHLSLTAAPGEFNPDSPPGIDFAAGETRIHMLLDGLPGLGPQTLESWTVVERADGGFALQGGNGIAIWNEDPQDPSRVELFVGVGQFSVELDRVDLPSVAGLPSGTLTGRVAFDAAGLVVELGDGPPRIVGQIGDQTIPVFAEFSVAIRLSPVGVGTIGIEGGPNPLPPLAIGAPRGGHYQEGLLLDYSVALQGQDGTTKAFANQLWIGTPGVGVFSVDEALPADIESGEAYIPEKTWAWSAAGTDIQAVFQGTGPTNAFSSGGTLSITDYVAAGPDEYGLIVGEFAVPETVFGPGGTTQTQVLSATFTAPILPLTMTTSRVLPPSELSDLNRPLDNPSRIRLGTGTGQIVGRVLEDGFTTVPGVTVSITGPSGSGEVVSNELGLFWIDGLDAGDYTVEWEVPVGFQLAAGEESVLSPVRVGEDVPVSLELNLADEAGNGLLRVFASDVEAQSALDGVSFVVRATDSDEVLATLVSGTDRRGSAMHKLQPGTYDIEVVAPDGWVLRAGDPNPVEVRVAKGRLAFKSAALVRR